MSSKNKVLKLKNKIRECRKKTEELLQEKEKEGWSEMSQIMEQTKGTIQAELRSQKQCNSISKSEKEIEDLKEKIKYVEEYEADLKLMLERSQVSFGEYKKFKESELRKIQRRIDEMEHIISDQSSVNELGKRHNELQNRLKDLNDFFVAMYSTLEAKESKKHI